MMALLMAAALVQGAEPEIFAETEGWSIARHDGGCLMTQEYDGAGNTIITFAVSPADPPAPRTEVSAGSTMTVTYRRMGESGTDHAQPPS